MSYKKISELTLWTPLETDILPYVDLVSWETKKAYKSELKWEKWDKWDKWEIWPQGIQWLKGDKWDQWIQGIQWEVWPKWIQGIQWETWKWIVSIVRTSWDGSPWTTDTYTITYTDATTSTFQVYNWANWTWTWTWSLNYVAVTSNQSISPSNFYWVTCTTSDITLTLADWTSIWENLTIKKLDNTPYNITISGNIEQDWSIIIDTQFESIDLFWNWTYYLIK